MTGSDRREMSVSVAALVAAVVAVVASAAVAVGAMRLIADRYANRVSGPSQRRAGGHPEVRRNGSIGRQSSGHGENGWMIAVVLVATVWPASPSCWWRSRP